MTEQPSLSPQSTDRRSLFDEHVSLDRQCTELIFRTTTGDWRDCDALWDAFSKGLERHMAYEENDLFPAYAKSSQTAAQLVKQLSVEHKVFRQLLDSIGIDIQLHLARVEVLKELVDLLLSHAQREGLSLYPWIDEQTAHNKPRFGYSDALC